jgi:GMP synthase-like glutamine amidotransferase
MKVAILETGRPPSDLAQTFGDYPAMFERLLGDGFEFETLDVVSGELPGDPSRYDGYIITGSPAGVYDDHDWMAKLSEFIRAATSRKLVGVCFGHQAMAQALGGQVEKSDRGWGIGLHLYRIEKAETWMDPVSQIAIPVSHQDQVVVQPPNTKVLASSQFTPFAALAWTDRPAISVQFHPEFDPGYAKALIDYRRDRLPDPDGAIASLDAPNDNALVAKWIRRFLMSQPKGET